MEVLNLNQAEVLELDIQDLALVEGGFLPLAVMVGCWAFTASCAAITVCLGAGYYNNR
ncbi:class IIb bacteriocin, lactobin A/cerein 7B family [Spirosoma sp. SC4-14]|uniref:class IIb bacteriocin, lactobin A/cerein 7B family n=1 Tax=Spirosoma sp. SC4-14 TaxID=3128900 RepID=UPI0030CF583E